LLGATADDGRAGMIMELALGVTEGPRAAEITGHVFFKKATNFVGFCARSFRRGEPACDFRRAFVHGDAVDFEAGGAEILQQFAERKGADVGGVAQDFEAILVGGAIRMFAGEEIFDEDDTPGAANARHFLKHSGRLFDVMQSIAANDDDEHGVDKGQSANVAGAKGNIF
jgi:hypothetical protein